MQKYLKILTCWEKNETCDRKEKKRKLKCENYFILYYYSPITNCLNKAIFIRKLYPMLFDCLNKTQRAMIMNLE